MKLPKSVKVGPFNYKIIFPHNFTEDDDLAGQNCFNELQIKISDKGINNKDTADEVIAETFIHEILHAIDDVYLDSCLKEKNIAILSRGILQVFLDNKINLSEMITKRSEK